MYAREKSILNKGSVAVQRKKQTVAVTERDRVGKTLRYITRLVCVSEVVREIGESRGLRFHGGDKTKRRRKRKG